jgi:hypothetical protein
VNDRVDHGVNSGMSSSVGTPVTLHAWRVPKRRIPAATWRVATDRRRLRRLVGVRFAALLGTAQGFSPAGPDLTRWVAVVSWDDAAHADAFEQTGPARGWQELATGYCRLDLRTVASRGRWAGSEPFPITGACDTDGPVLALTRARLRPSRAVAFWRAQAAPAEAATHARGLICAFGIGEAPVGWQGTVSVWHAIGDLVEFAYRTPDHRRVVDATPERQWYAEELFARFAVVAVTGNRDVIGWRTGEDGSGAAR